MQIKVFKFGGASVKSAEAVKNVVNIIKLQENQKILIVVSAMGKTTNALEKLMHQSVNEDPKRFDTFKEIEHYHRSILEALIPDHSHPAYVDFRTLFSDLAALMEDYQYVDQQAYYSEMVSFGELISTKIVHHYFSYSGYKSHWLEAGCCLITAGVKMTEATVDWKISPSRIQQHVLPIFENHDLVITQGFIAKNLYGKTTTLGREGSDYSAAIFAYALDAQNLTIWKDVPGLLNADPKYFANTQKIDSLSYNETIELAYFGASIIHPKTIQPLQNKHIPLFIKSFLEPKESGSIIGEAQENAIPIPSYIFKKDQVLISISTRDFAFVAEQNLVHIFKKLTDYGLKINLMQNSAISFSICMDFKSALVMPFVTDLQKEFKVKYNEQLELITIRNYNQSIIDELIGNRKVYLEQKNRTTVQLLVK
jgi:aspartate kinase